MALLDRVMSFPVAPDVSEAFDQIPNELNELGYDPWGFNPEYARRAYTFGKKIFAYFRPSIHGIENLPEGRVLLIANHSGQLPFDGMVISVACLLHANPPRVVRAMAERWFPTLPFVSELFVRSGVAVGDPINCRNLLEADNAILVFPEGARGCGKTIQRKYELVRFGRGFMRLALQTDTPIVPIGVVGAEESIPSVYDAKPLARLLGAPYFPVPVHAPLLGPLAWLPLPTRFSIYFGEPLRFEGAYDDEDEVIDGKVDRVKGAIRELLDRGLAERESIF